MGVCADHSYGAPTSEEGPCVMCEGAAQAGRDAQRRFYQKRWDGRRKQASAQDAVEDLPYQSPASDAPFNGRPIGVDPSFFG